MSREPFTQALLEEEARGAARFLLPLLALLSLPYAGLIRLRNYFYGKGLFRVHTIGVPVISVGNITVGGTGKTPLVARLVRLAMEQGFTPAVVARGYKGKREGGELLNDEGLLLRQEIPGLVVVQDPDRVAAARKAVREKGADCVILDDAFQHRRIGRDLDVVALDARSPFSTGRMLPAGLLREPAAGLARADIVVLTRCDRVGKNDLEAAAERVKAHAAGAPLFFCDHVPTAVSTVRGGEELEPSHLEGKAVFLCSAIADHGAFRRTALSLGVRVKGERIFRDHHDFGPGDVRRVVKEAREAGAEAVLTTAKDGVKLHAFPDALDFLVLKIEIRFRERKREFFEAITSSTLRRPRNEPQTSR